MLPGNIQKFFIEFRLSEIVTLKESYNRNRGKFFFLELEGGRKEYSQLPQYRSRYLYYLFDITEFRFKGSDINVLEFLEKIFTPIIAAIRYIRV